MIAWARLAVVCLVLLGLACVYGQRADEFKGEVLAKTDFGDGYQGWRILDTHDRRQRSLIFGGDLSTDTIGGPGGWTDWSWVGPESGSHLGFHGDLQSAYDGELVFTLVQPLVSSYRTHRAWRNPKVSRYSQAFTSAKWHTTWLEEKVWVTIEGKNGKSLEAELADSRSKAELDYILEIDEDDKPSVRAYRVRLNEKSGLKGGDSKKAVQSVLSDVKRISIRSSQSKGSRGRIGLQKVFLVAPPEPIVIIDRSTHGYHNDSIGKALKGTSDAFPEDKDPKLRFDSAPGLGPANPVLGGWLQSPPRLPSQHWEFGEVPRYWKTGTDTAVVYEFNVPKDGYEDVRLSLGADNGLFAWLDGKYLGGYISPGGTRLGEWDLELGRLEPGPHFLQFLRVDHGSINGFAILMTGLGEPPLVDSVVDDLVEKPQSPDERVQRVGGDSVVDDIDKPDQNPELGILLERGNDKYIPKWGAVTYLTARIYRNENGSWIPVTDEEDKRKISIEIVEGSTHYHGSGYDFSLNPIKGTKPRVHAPQRGGMKGVLIYEDEYYNDEIGRDSDYRIEVVSPKHEYRAYVKCRGAGGYARFVARAQEGDCALLIRDRDEIKAVGSDRAGVMLPMDNNRNGIADYYYHKRSGGRLARDGSFGPKKNYDGEASSKFKTIGDGIPAYEEYRMNLMYDGVDTLAYDQKDMVVYLPFEMGTEMFEEFEKLTGITVHRSEWGFADESYPYLSARIVYSKLKGAVAIGPDSNRYIRLDTPFYKRAVGDPELMAIFKEELTSCLLRAAGLDPYDVKSREAKLLRPIDE